MPPNKILSANSILMGFWEKEYWLQFGKMPKGKVDEKQQLRNASNFTKNRNNPNFLAKLNSEVMKTTFQSSATNSYHNMVMILMSIISII